MPDPARAPSWRAEGGKGARGAGVATGEFIGRWEGVIADESPICRGHDVGKRGGSF